MIHVVLFEPEIPQNTGNIMRTCAATKTKLHLIEPLGFELDKDRLKRATAGYIEHTSYEVHENFDAFLEKYNPKHVVTLTRYATQTPKEYTYPSEGEDIFLLFGNESSGLPMELLSRFKEHALRLPMIREVRSLNLSNTVAIMVYDVLRSVGYDQLETYDHQKGYDYIT